MKELIGAGLVAGAIAVTAGGGVSIAAEGWPEAALVALAVAGAFGLGGWSADCRLPHMAWVGRKTDHVDLIGPRRVLIKWQLTKLHTS